MKALRTMSVFLLAAALLIVPVSAALDFTPSVQEKEAEFVSTETNADGVAVVGYVTDDSGKLDPQLTAMNTKITPLADAEKADEKVRGALQNAEKLLKENPITALVAEFAEKWEEITEGAPAENAAVAHVFDITTDHEIADHERMTFTIKNPGIGKDVPMMILHNYEGDKWEIVPHTRNAAGDITFTVDSLSPFAIVVDNAKAPAVGEGAPQSPGTGVDSQSVMPAVMIACLFAGLSAVCFVKASKRTAK